MTSEAVRASKQLQGSFHGTLKNGGHIHNISQVIFTTQDVSSSIRKISFTSYSLYVFLALVIKKFAKQSDEACPSMIAV